MSRLGNAVRKLFGLEYESALNYNKTYRAVSPASQRAVEVPREEEIRRFHISYYPRDTRRGGGVLSTSASPGTPPLEVHPEPQAPDLSSSGSLDPRLPITARPIVRWNPGFLVDEADQVSSK